MFARKYVDELLRHQRKGKRTSCFGSDCTEFAAATAAAAHMSETKDKQTVTVNFSSTSRMQSLRRKFDRASAVLVTVVGIRQKKRQRSHRGSQ